MVQREACLYPSHYKLCVVDQSELLVPVWPYATVLGTCPQIFEERTKAGGIGQGADRIGLEPTTLARCCSVHTGRRVNSSGRRFPNITIQRAQDVELITIDASYVAVLGNRIKVHS